MNTLDEMKSYDLEDFTGSKDSSTEFEIAGILTDDGELKAVDENLDDTWDIVHDEGNGLMGDEKKAGIIQKVLFMIHFNQET